MIYDKVFIKFIILLTVLALPFDLWGQAGTAKGSVRLPSGGEEQVKDIPIEEGGKLTPEGERPSDQLSDEMVYLNVQEQDIKDVIRQISKATGRNFIIDDKIRGKVTIMSERMMTKEEAYQTFLSALEVAGYTTVMGPGGIIKVVSLKEAISSPIPIYVDTIPQTDSYVTRLISLQNISALDMSNAIKGLISKTGNMFAYPSTNTLVITDSGTNIDRLMKIIKELDQEGPQQVLEIIPINYADAKSVATTVLSIFEIDKKKTTRTSRTRSKAGSQLEELKDVSKIIADERTNSLIVLASKRAIKKVRDVIAKLDVPLEEGETGNIHVHYLKYANAVEMAETLASITAGAKKTTSKSKKGAKAKAGGGPVASLGEGISIGADESLNALIITASAKDYQMLKDELISKLDVPRRQVYLEAVVMELDVRKNFTGGATGYGGGGNNTLIGFGGSSHAGFSPATFFTPGGLFSQPGMLGGLLSRDTITIDIPQSGGGTQQLTIPAFAAFLNFLQTNSQANIVSTPNILTLDNQKASIDVTKTIYAKKVSQSGTTGFQSIEPTPLEAGLSLEITPQITEGDAVRLEIHHKLSNFTSLPSPETGAADTTKRELRTTVVAMNAQTVVLGGLMQDIETADRSKIPLLGDIPIIGWLFSRRTKSYSKSNLLVFITPYVIRDPSDFVEITKNKIQQRNKFIEKNFGRRKQKAIRDTIAMHRADLLEFTQPVSTVPSATTHGQPVVGPGMSSSATQPVITVPSVDSGASTTKNMAYGSRKLKPVMPPLQSPSTTSPGSPNLGGTGNVDLAY